MALTDDRRREAPLSEPSPSDEELGKMTLFEHLAELRNRLLVAVAAVVVGTVVTWFFYDDILRFILHPYHSFVAHHPSKDISKGQLVTTGPLEGFTTRLKVSVYGGLIIASPVLF